MNDQKLIDDVIAQIITDIDSCQDLTALEELLSKVPENLLRGYLPEAL